MSAGKTTAGKIIVRQLKQAGYKVIGAKLTGAARYRDVLSIGDAGADYIFDFVDVGLPSSICEPENYRNLLRKLITQMARVNADVLVAEAGASPLEPYNGSVVIEELKQQVRCTVLCASDPYAVVGVSSAFDRKPDIVAGGAANTAAGIALVEKLTGIKGLNLMEKDSLPELNRILSECLGFSMKNRITNSNMWNRRILRHSFGYRVFSCGCQVKDNKQGYKKTSDIGKYAY